VKTDIGKTCDRCLQPFKEGEMVILAYTGAAEDLSKEGFTADPGTFGIDDSCSVITAQHKECPPCILGGGGGKG
jgi:hypothetical protein